MAAKFKNKNCYLEVEGKKKVSKQSISKIIKLFNELNKEQEDKTED